MQLPEGVPEVLAVICNGRSAALHLRTQRVTFNGAEMSASRFESVCGKGDAKKWKCSVHLEAAPGVSGEVSAVSHAPQVQVHVTGWAAWTQAPTRQCARIMHLEAAPGSSGKARTGCAKPATRRPPRRGLRLHNLRSLPPLAWTRRMACLGHLVLAAPCMDPDDQPQPVPCIMAGCMVWAAVHLHAFLIFVDQVPHELQHWGICSASLTPRPRPLEQHTSC